MAGNIYKERMCMGWMVREMENEGELRMRVRVREKWRNRE